MNRRRRGTRASNMWLQRLLEICQRSCAYCQRPFSKKKKIQTTFDHFIPLDLGGTNRLENLLPCCRGCNNRKGSEDPYRWMERTGVDAKRVVDLRDAWYTMLCEHFTPALKKVVDIEMEVA